MEENLPTANPASGQPAPAAPQHKTNPWMILSIVLITAIVTGGAVFFFFQNSKRKAAPEVTGITPQASSFPSVSSLPEGTPIPTPSLVSLDANFNKYTNPFVGFSIKVPKQKAEFYGQCEYVNTNGDHSYRPKTALVPVKVFEDNNLFFIAGEYSYKLTGETKVSGTSYFSGCDKTVNTISILKSNMTEGNHAPWAIEVKNVADDKALDSFLKERYGSGCSVGEKKTTGQSGVFDVLIKGDGKEMPDSKCFVNYITEVRYYPAKKIVAAWDIGQACAMANDLKNTCVDQEMTDSFLFEQPITSL